MGTDTKFRAANSFFPTNGVGEIGCLHPFFKTRYNPFFARNSARSTTRME